MPIVIVAVGLYFFFAPLGLTQTYTGLIVAHAALGAPFVVVTVSASLASFDRNFARAAASLGAPPVTVFRRVMLPLVAPGVASGAIFAFATSFDEVVTVLLLGAPHQRTIPREMFSGLRDSFVRRSPPSPRSSFFLPFFCSFRWSCCASAQIVCSVAIGPDDRLLTSFPAPRVFHLRPCWNTIFSRFATPPRNPLCYAPPRLGGLCRQALRPTKRRGGEPRRPP
ncbi:MAG: ABC transporter permease subunit [Hyphomicrobiales bacterium]